MREGGREGERERERVKERKIFVKKVIRCRDKATNIENDRSLQNITINKC